MYSLKRDNALALCEREDVASLLCSVRDRFLDKDMLACLYGSHSPLKVERIGELEASSAGFAA